MYKERILSKTSPERDTLQDVPEKSLVWTNVKKQSFPYPHSRPLPNVVAQEAIDYIKVLVSGYPFQIRYHMAIPLWERFAREWCDSGDAKKALRAI